MNSFYDFLRLPKDSSLETLKNTISARALEINPTGVEVGDLSGVKQSQWRVLQAAKETLTDPAKRLQYDSSLVKITTKESTPRLEIKTLPERSTPNGNSLYGNTPRPSAKTEIHTKSCTVCNTPFQGGSAYCQVCGTMVESAAPAMNTTYTGQVSSMAPKEKNLTDVAYSFLRLLGWRKVEGTIVTAEAPYSAENEFILWKFLLKLGIFFWLASIIYDWASNNIVFVLLGGVVILLLAIFASAIFCLVFGQLLTLLFSAKVFGKEKQIQVRDVRLRDTQLQEHVVRFRGELRAGQVAVGDTIEIWGRNRGGTVMARWGYNFRTKTRIVVKYR
jgi:hypothetical protein